MRSFILFAAGMVAIVFGTTNRTDAQKFADLKTPKSPLVLKAQGSFYVGGDVVEQTRDQLGSRGPAGHITVNQMYVRYMIPQKSERKASVVLIHGSTLTGKSWETTPDGRMGWDEYFVRKGHAVYVPDQVGRGRSGFNQALYNDVRVGAVQPNTLPLIWRFSDEVVFPNFRFGPKPGAPYPGLQFPVEALGELSKQAVPDLLLTLPTPNPSYKALSDLAGELKRTVLISHSQSGASPLEAALVNPAGIEVIVMVEPGVCPATYTDSQIGTLAKLPILIIYGDHLGDVPTGIPGFSWQTAYEGCRSFVSRVNAAGGKARVMYLPDEGIPGNSHMIMLDKNSLRIADLILKWNDESTSGRKGKK